MRVLSLFDGISCGRVALERCKINIESYYASEIDKYAIKIAQKNYPSTIQLGDIALLNESNTPKDIDILVGGSPCVSFSKAGKGDGFDGKSGLFYQFLRVLKIVNPKYFLLENVCMKKQYEEIISKELGVNPILIDSSSFSAQTRKRLYWTNIEFNKNIIDKNILLDDIFDFKENKKLDCLKCSEKAYNKMIEKSKSKSLKTGKIYNYYNNRWCNQKTPTLTSNSQCWSASGGFSISYGQALRKPSIEECQKLQTLDVGYTSGAGVSDTQRYKCIGNGWTVDVISHILKGI